MSEKKPALGRGLADLLGASKARAATPAAPVPITPPAAAAPSATSGPRNDELAHLPIDSLARGKYQPRTDLRQEALEELAISIRNHLRHIYEKLHVCCRTEAVMKYLQAGGTGQSA